MKGVNIGNSRIIFEKYLSKKFDTQERRKLIEFATKSNYSEIPHDYSFVKVFVTSRTIYDAVNQALEKLDLIRGIWNYIINWSSPYRFTFGGKPNPINKIILGPIHTLQFTDGRLATDIWWYEPNYFGPIKPYQSNPLDFEKIKHSESNIRKKIDKLNYSTDLDKAIIRYTKALDERDMSNAYLKLWGVIEFLTGTTKGTSHEVIAKRVASLYEYRDFHLHALRILKDFRNSYVHNGEETNELEIYLNQLKNYVESLIQFHLINKFHFKSITQAAEFFDLPTNKEQIKYKIKLYNFMKQYRRY
jgi:hypothetical protein